MLPTFLWKVKPRRQRGRCGDGRATIIFCLVSHTVRQGTNSFAIIIKYLLPYQIVVNM